MAIVATPNGLQPRRTPALKKWPERQTRLQPIWEAFGRFCNSHNILYRSTFNGAVILGTGASAMLLQAGALVGALASAGVVALSVAIREITGSLYSSGRIPVANRAVAQKVLRLACEALTPDSIPERPQGTKIIRANIMRMHQDEMLRIWTSFNMDEDNDRELIVDPNSGVVGDVWRRSRVPVCFDFIQNPNDPRRLLEPPQANAAVRTSLRSILATPIYDPFASGDAGPPRKIGILCFDSDFSADEIGFDRPYAQDMASLVADLLAITVRQSDEDHYPTDEA